MAKRDIAAEREKRLAELAEAKAAQFEADDEALFDLQVEHGDNRVAAVPVDFYVKGLPTFMVVKAPAGPYYKRFLDALNKSKDNDQAKRMATEVLGESCIVYPAPGSELFTKMLEAFPPMKIHAGNQAVLLVRFVEKEEKKD